MLNMAKVTIGFAGAFIVLGLVGYFGSGMASVTALIPAFFGIAVGICGVLGLKPSRRMPATVVALIIAILGAGGTLSRLVPDASALTLDLATISQVLMALLSLAYIAWAGWWLIRGRRARKPLEAGPGT